MQISRFFIPFSVFLAPLLTLSACFSTHLPALDHHASIQRLRQLASTELALSVNSEAVNGVAGFQFLTVLPVTRVYTPNFKEDLSAQLSLDAGLRGYRTVSPESAGGSTNHLSVTVQELTVSGYCYFIMRQPHAQITLRGELRAPDGHLISSCETAASSSFTARFAFSTELNEVLRISITDASAQLFTCLGIKTAR